MRTCEVDEAQTLLMLDTKDLYGNRTLHSMSIQLLLREDKNVDIKYERSVENLCNLIIGDSEFGQRFKGRDYGSFRSNK
jgi:hypothetical protein